ncbi:PREDICTED: uncharacterized protein LOC104827030 [Tarenaya hassleriana]|uniref:uncharacterized protein LOC104827030 n=1 Tax=Tarenaya hassleriana TaxID=28532 RepID=UPI00053C72E0|nr:PREDICTED: uncharacterized protein LOC104827030 [Tarenaya hassleriana]
MEGKKKVGSSSLTSELFGSRENSSSSSTSGIFESIFAPPSKALGRESLRPETVTGGWSKPVESSNEAWNNKAADTGVTGRRIRGDEKLGLANEGMGSIYQEQRVQPCHLSSSIYYGGQDDYAQPQSVSDSSMYSTYKKDGVEDDSGSASRGNWWQGSLYY